MTLFLFIVIGKQMAVIDMLTINIKQASYRVNTDCMDIRIRLSSRSNNSVIRIIRCCRG